MRGALHSIHCNERGMTLIEVMISIAILGMITALVWGGYSQTAHNKKRIEEDIERQQSIQLSLDRMQREISMAYVSAQVHRDPSMRQMQTIFKGVDRSGDDRLSFTSFSHRRLYRNAHESDQNEISYFLTEHPDEPGKKVLARREDSRVDENPEEGGRIQILLDNVEELEFEYLDPMSGQWLDAWDTNQTIGQPNRLPSQVKIKIVVPHLRKEGTSVEYGTRATIPLVWGLNHSIYNA